MVSSYRSYKWPQRISATRCSSMPRCIIGLGLGSCLPNADISLINLGVTIKYGVTTVDNLCADLLGWKSLYMAGRMHKPIRIIKVCLDFDVLLYCISNDFILG